jgi:hypothetical protein
MSDIHDNGRDETPLWIDVAAFSRASDHLDLVTLGAVTRLLHAYPVGDPPLPLGEPERVLMRVSKHAWPRRKSEILENFYKLQAQTKFQRFNPA